MATPPESSQWPALAEIDPEFIEIYKSSAGVGFVQSREQLPSLRDGMIKMLTQSIASRDNTGVVEERIDIPVREGSMPPAYVFKPEMPPSSGSPLAFLVHAGGYLLGHPYMEAQSAHILVREYGAVVVCIDYRLAPEHPFPTPANDTWDALQWVAAHAEELGADPARGFLVGGTSAGANLAAAATSLAGDEKLSPPITAQFLSIPPILYPEVVPARLRSEYQSMEQNRDAPLLRADTLKLMRELYQPDVTSPLAVPFNWPTGLAGLPPTYIQVCGLDPFRDDGLLYERELRASGVATRLNIYAGLPHGFWGMHPQLSQSKQELLDRQEAFEWLMKKA